MQIRGACCKTISWGEAEITNQWLSHSIIVFRDCESSFGNSKIKIMAIFTRYILIVFTLFLVKSRVWSSLCSIITQEKSTGSRIVTLSDRLILDCNQSLYRQSKWSFNNSVLFVNGISVTSKFEDTIILFANNSLLIRTVLFKHQGLFQCMTEQLTMHGYVVTVIGKFIQILGRHRATRLPD